VPWYNAFGLGRRSPVDVSMTARTEAFAAQQVRGPDTKFLPKTQSWQEEVWGFYDTLGEFNYAVTWLSNMISRVRLRAAELKPGQDEPTIVDSGPAADLMDRLAGGVPGQSQMMAALSVQLSAPGEGFLIGEVTGRAEDWTVRSIDEVRVQSGKYQVVDSRLPGIEWRDLSPDSLVTRVWRQHKRYYHLADSSARSALPTMKELELVNRHIVAQYLSRLASAGIVILPDEVQFPVREEFEDSVDPFMSEWVEIAAEAIRQPGTASAVIPMPMRMPAEFIGKVQHLDFTMRIDDKILEKRESAIKRLATQVNIPAEVLLGMGDVNHWGAWQLEEGAVKANVVPDVELICDALTKGYLQPRLSASGESDTSKWVVWYDTSELTLRPDRTDNAVQLYDRLELSGAALRREGGFNEDDKPTDGELKEQGLKVIINSLPSGASSALAQLVGEEAVDVVVPISAQSPEEAEAAPAPAEEPSPAQGPPEPPKETATATRQERLLRQSRLTHAVRLGPGKAWELLHPQGCAGHAYSCPFTHATWNLSDRARPGTSGVYECRLDAFGAPVIGPRAPHLDTTDFLTTVGGSYVRTR